MDCRKPLFLFLGLLAGAGGCTTTLPGVRLLTAPTPPGPTEIVHKAPTYVAFGDFRARSALEPEHPPAQREQFREEARRAYLKAIEVDPKYLPAYVALARLLQVGEDHAEAANVYQKALAVEPGNAALWFELGMCQCRVKNWGAALTNMRKGLELDPNNRKYATITGYALARAGQWDEAIAILSRAQGPARAHYDVARMLRHLNQTTEARQHAQMAVSADPNLQVARDLLNDLDGKQPAPGPIQTASYSETRPAAPVIQTAATAATTDRPGLAQIITPGSMAAAPSVEGGLAGTTPQASSPECSSVPIRVPPLPIINIRSRGQ
jgi:tetratricopeptide (TPR) repeat protein